MTDKFDGSIAYKFEKPDFSWPEAFEQITKTTIEPAPKEMLKQFTGYIVVIDDVGDLHWVAFKSSYELGDVWVQLLANAD